jgi:uncharacterized phage protein (TIGR01671 family)
MREIECRGWDKDTKRWYYGSYVRLERTTPYPMSQNPELDAQKFEEEQVDHYIFFTESMDWGLETRKLRATVDPKSVGQYTGLKDNSGVKIYEGDIVNITLNLEVGDEEYWNDENLSVEWNDDSWCIGDYRLSTYAKGDDWDRSIRVIGNIYQNPELLNTPHAK